MVFMDVTKIEFPEKDRKKAEFIALLTDSVLHFDDDKNVFALVGKKEIPKIIKTAYEKGDYSKVSMILETAKNSTLKKFENEMIEIIPKSIRVDGQEFLRLLYCRRLFVHILFQLMSE